MTRIFAGVIAVVAVVISIALSTEKYIGAGQPLWLALGIPIALIGFVNLIFEVGWGMFIRARQGVIYSKTKLKKELIPEGLKIARMRYFGATVCIISALLLEGVNVLNILEAQMSSIQDKLTTKISVSSVDAGEDVTELGKDKATLEAQKAELQNDWKQRKAELTKVINGLYSTVADRVNSPEYTDYKKKESSYDTSIVEINKKIEAKQGDIEKARQLKLTAKTTESASKEGYVGSVYSFLANIINPKDPRLSLYIQFWIVTLPSLFLGIISCVSLSLAIYSKPPKKEQT